MCYAGAVWASKPPTWFRSWREKKSHFSDLICILIVGMGDSKEQGP